MKSNFLDLSTADTTAKHDTTLESDDESDEESDEESNEESDEESDEDYSSMPELEEECVYNEGYIRQLWSSPTQIY